MVAGDGASHTLGEVSVLFSADLDPIEKSLRSLRKLEQDTSRLLSHAARNLESFNKAATNSTASLTHNLKEANRELERFISRSSGIKDFGGKNRGGFGAGFGTMQGNLGQSSHMVSRSLAELNRISDETARSLGVNFEKMSGSFKKLGKASGELGSVSKALVKYNTNIAEMGNIKPIEKSMRGINQLSKTLNRNMAISSESIRQLSKKSTASSEKLALSFTRADNSIVKLAQSSVKLAPVGGVFQQYSKELARLPAVTQQVSSSMRDSVREIINVTEQSLGTTENFGQKLGSTPRRISPFSTLATNIKKDATKIGKATKKAGVHINDLTKKAGRSFSFMGDWDGKLSGIVKGYLSFITAKKILLLGDSYNTLTKRLRLATEATADYNHVMSELQKTSFQTGTSLSGNIKMFEDLSRVSDNILPTSSELLQFNKTLAQISNIGDLSTEQQKSMMLQLTHIIAGGVFNMNEFNSLMMHSSLLVKYIADGMHKTVGELKDAVGQGNVLAVDVFESILSQGSEINKMAGEFEDTLAVAAKSFFGAAGLGLSKLSNDVLHLNTILKVIFKAGTAGIKSLVEDSSPDAMGNIKQSTLPLAGLFTFGHSLVDPIMNGFTESLRKKTELEKAENQKITKDLIKDYEIAYVKIGEIRHETLAKSSIDLNAIFNDSMAKHFTQENIKDQIIAYGKMYDDISLMQKTALTAPSLPTSTLATGPAARTSRLAKNKLAKETEEMQAKFKILEDSLRTENEIQSAHYKENLALINDAERLKLNSLVGFTELRKRLGKEDLDNQKSLIEESKYAQIAQGLWEIDFNRKLSDEKLSEQGAYFRRQLDIASQSSEQLSLILAGMDAMVKAIDNLNKFSQGFGMLKSGFSLGGLLTTLGGAFGLFNAGVSGGQALQNSEHRASGGPTSAFSSYRINERGTEIYSEGGNSYLLTGNNRGYVSPMQGGAGGTSVNVKIINNAPVQVNAKRNSADDIEILIEEVDSRMSDRLLNNSSRTGRALSQIYNLNRSY